MFTTSEAQARQSGRYREQGSGGVEYRLVDASAGSMTDGSVDLIVVPAGGDYVTSPAGGESGSVVVNGTGVLLTTEAEYALEPGTVLQADGEGEYRIRAGEVSELRVIRFSSPRASPTGSTGEPAIRAFHLTESTDHPFHVPEKAFFHLSARWLVDEENGHTQGFVLGQSTFDADRGSHELHRHPFAEEVFYVWEGEGVHLTPDGGEVRMGPGELVFVPMNEWHGFRNTGSIPVRAVFGYLGANSLDAGGYELPGS
jgi:mannose-6-phosphate isomerase-like protein (cupin superfamily)